METFAQQLDRVIKEKRIPVKYSQDYHEWKQRFETAFRNTRNVTKSLDIAESNNSPTQAPQK